MKTLLMAVVAFVMVLPAALRAQDWSAAAYWNLKTKESSVVALTKVGAIRRPLGLGIDLDVDAFAGSTLAGNVLAGFSVGGSFPLAENLTFKLALGTDYRLGMQPRDFSLGLILGVTWKF